MYRDDVCAVCGDSLPPDHLYCREHAAEVDDRLHELGELLPRVDSGLRRAAELLDSIHPETWDHLARGVEGDPLWPPRPAMVTTTDGEDVEVDVDSEPGQVTVSLTVELARLLGDVAAAMRTAQVDALAAAARAAEGLGATH
ncbi:MAG TPA: hypothetical protein VMM13_06410 [Euzebya sp.]|nr:hypothetical protein [Euzebya sp.]